MNANEPTDFTKIHDQWVEQVALSEPPIDYSNVWEYRKRGNGKEKKQFTFSPGLIELWETFLIVFSGAKSKRGKGISSTMVELAMRLLIAIIADYKIEEVAEQLSIVLPSDLARRDLRTNLERLISYL